MSKSSGARRQAKKQKGARRLAVRQAQKREGGRQFACWLIQFPESVVRVAEGEPLVTVLFELVNDLMGMGDDRWVEGMHWLVHRFEDRPETHLILALASLRQESLGVGRAMLAEFLETWPEHRYVAAVQAMLGVVDSRMHELGLVPEQMMLHDEVKELLLRRQPEGARALLQEAVATWPNDHRAASVLEMLNAAS